MLNDRRENIIKLRFKKKWHGMWIGFLLLGWVPATFLFEEKKSNETPRSIKGGEFLK